MPYPYRETVELITEVCAAELRAQNDGRVRDTVLLEKIRLHMFALDMKLQLASRACYDVPVIVAEEDKREVRDRTRAAIYARIIQIANMESLLEEA
jgi:hypothetical protein